METLLSIAGLLFVGWGSMFIPDAFANWWVTQHRNPYPGIENGDTSKEAMKAAEPHFAWRSATHDSGRNIGTLLMIGIDIAILYFAWPYLAAVYNGR